jgi:hypothetical protein
MTEQDYRIAQGRRQVTLAQLVAEYHALGYRFDRSLDTIGLAQHVTGPMAGTHYTARTLYPVETDTGRSAFHVLARRDAQFQRLQQLRNELFCVDSRGRIIEV